MSFTSFNPGTGGRVVAVKANTFKITRLPTKKFYQYHFEMNPDDDRADRRLVIFMKLQEQNALMFQPRAVFDGRFNLYSSLGNLERQYIVRMGNPQPQNSNARPRKEIIITLTLTKEINPLRINESFKTKQEQVSDILAMLQIFIRQAVATRFVYPPTSKTVYTNDGYRPLGSGLEMWRGVFQSVRLGMDRLFINVDASHGIMYAHGSLISNVMELLRVRDTRDIITLVPGSPKWNQMKVFLRNVQVSVTMFPNKRPRAIVDIVPKAGRHVFMWHDEEVTVAEYFKRTHSLRIDSPDMFGVVLSKTRRDVVPAQFCNIVGGQMYKKRVPPEVTQMMIRNTETKPQQRLDIITRAVSGQNLILDYAHSDFMNNAGLSVDEKPMDIQARYIQAPKIEFGDGSVNPNNGAWNVVNHQFLKCGYILCWRIVNFEQYLDKNLLQRFAETLVRCLTKLGIRQVHGSTLGMPALPEIHNGLGYNAMRSLEDVFNQMKVGEAWDKYIETSKQAKQYLPLEPSPLIIVILPTSAADIRKEVKQWGDMITGVPTQCVRQDKLQKANDQYCNNLALKINARLSGTNSTAVDAWMKGLGTMPTMVAAADVSHPGPGIIHRPSMAGLVASTDINFSRYAAFSRIQNPRLEIIEELEAMIKDALFRFGEINFRDHSTGRAPVLPGRLIFYRDGVSEGEYQQIVDKEVPRIKAGIDSAWARFPTKVTSAPPKPKLTVIVVGKRHHIRFFPADPRGSDGRTGNCLGGLVVDRDVNAQGAFFDFYLQSQGGLKGSTYTHLSSTDLHSSRSIIAM